ncbi:hypothetical protein BDN72DRAFT_864912 [Pluteus cervinus]|uniref:Uncharacterized protein n=1 Tax=Pluteus cervinus TaxID=181527 RepID=A0ACD3A4G4_9AGAR|nr:hypothetical protein BDN72DRAFT_864912 [Pluteus cervinus]
MTFTLLVSTLGNTQIDTSMVSGYWQGERSSRRGWAGRGCRLHTGSRETTRQKTDGGVVKAGSRWDAAVTWDRNGGRDVTLGQDGTWGREGGVMTRIDWIPRLILVCVTVASGGSLGKRWVDEWPWGLGMAEQVTQAMTVPSASIHIPTEAACICTTLAYPGDVQRLSTSALPTCYSTTPPHDDTISAGLVHSSSAQVMGLVSDQQPMYDLHDPDHWYLAATTPSHHSIDHPT